MNRNIRVINSYLRSKNKPTLDLRVTRYRNIYYSLKNAVDFIRLLVLRKKGFDELIRVEGLDGLKSSYDQGHGVIGLCLHLGNWELGGSVLTRRGFKVSSLVFGQLDPVLELFVNKARSGAKVGVLNQRSGIREGLRRLGKGELLAVHCDQDGTRNGHFLRFFGLHCSFPRVIELYALKSKASIHPMVMAHDPDSDGYVIRFYPKIEVDRENLKENLDEFYELLKHTLEEQILEVPEQWLLLYDRFKLRHDALLREQGLLDSVRSELEEAGKE
jgi:Kdo2-lipid IVA lauroyltransferase/acyltransferase